MFSKLCLGFLLAGLLGCGKAVDQPAPTSKKAAAGDASRSGTHQVSPLPAKSSPAADAPSEPLRVGGDVLPPVVLKRVQPDLTNLVGRYHSGGVPIIEATITATGDVTDVRVLRSKDPEVIAAMVAAVKQWKFKPATQNGKAVPVYFTMTMIIDVR